MHNNTLIIRHVSIEPDRFQLFRMKDGKATSNVEIKPPDTFPIEGRPNTSLNASQQALSCRGSRASKTRLPKQELGNQKGVMDLQSGVLQTITPETQTRLKVMWRRPGLNQDGQDVEG